MKIWQRSVFASLLVLLCVFKASAQEIGLAIGSRPPSVTLTDLEGIKVDLAQYIGKKPVLLEFWATWCPLCKALEPQLTSARQRFGNKVEVIVVAVGVNQSPHSIKRHIEKHKMPGRVLWDGDGEAVRAFMAPGTSYVVMLDKAGKVVYTGAGSEQKLLPALARAAK
ncbi:MAG TPA: TlpA disulfide reductase family protein [Longimicrobiales bacterium]|nr:TlpA disulfide reductase family protein [Longimicrobiales bacterium]